MSYNGSGTFVINSTGQPVVTNTTISSTVFNALTADLATGLSTAICKDGQTTTTARVPFASGISTAAATPAILTNGQAVSIALTSQTVGATTLTIPDFASVVDEFTFKTKAQTMANKTLTSPTLNSPTMTTPTLGVATATSISFGGTALSVYSESSFTGTFTGNTTTPTGTFKYTVIGNFVSLQGVATTLTSNATTKSVTGAPAAIQPATQQRCYGVVSAIDNGGTESFSTAFMETNGTINLYFGPASAWTNSGTWTVRAWNMNYQRA